MNSTTLKLALPALAAALALTACSPTENQAPLKPQETVTLTSTVAPESTTETPTPESAPPAGVRTVDFDHLQQVSPSMFTSGSVKAFRHFNGGRPGECFVHEGITCVGTADSSVPDVDMPPFSGRPGAVSIASAGLAYTILEGAPPAQVELAPGQWVDFGVAKCAKPDDASLVCSNDTAAFEVAGEDLRITTRGPVMSVEELAAQPQAEPATEYHTGEDVLVRGPIMCGAMEGRRLAEVIEGEITCAEAMDVLDNYDARAHTEGTGNTLSVSFNGWNCSSPTAARSQELRASTVCHDRERGIEVRDPRFNSAGS